jgi:hypothetical protein
MRDDVVFKLGKQPKRTDPRTLQLASYLSAKSGPPAQVNWGTKVTSWGMLGNDTVGDCAWAGQAHADMLWSSNTEAAPVDLTTTEVLAAYSAVTGYNPKDNGPKGNPTDKGTNLLDALKYWRSTGIDGQTITAFVEVQPKNLEHVKLAIDLFGCVYVGVELPDAVLPTASAVPPWTVSPNGTKENQPDPANGHCIIYAAYDTEGPTVVSWGQTITASWAFHSAYCDELYAMVSPDWFGAAGADPQGIDLAALTKDLTSLGKAPEAR